MTHAEASLVYAAMELAKKHPELAELVLQANATVAFVSGSTKKVWMERCGHVWDQVRADHRVREMKKAVVKGVRAL